MDADYLNALTTICGFNGDTADAIFGQGLEGPEFLVDTDPQEIDDSIKGMRKAYSGNPDINFPLPAARNLEAFALWCQDSDRRGFVPESHNFDADARDTMSERVKELKAHKRSKTDKPDVKALADMRDYRTFIEAFDNLLSTIRGAATAPLTYICRNEETPVDDDDVDASLDYDEMLCASLTLEGQHYKLDNKRVWAEFKALVVEGPAWTHVKRFNRTSDGRGAILALKLQMEGPNSFLLRRQAAYRLVANTYYRGHRQAFTFTDYIDKFLQAFNELEACEEIVSESRKVTLFLDNITDMSLVTAKSVIFGDRAKLESFQECQQYLANMVASLRVHSSTDKPSREISQADTSGGGSPMSADGTTKLCPTTSYDNTTWHSLSKDDKKKIFDMRRSSKKRGGGGGRGHIGRGNPGNGNSDGGRHSQLKRKLAALMQSQETANLERQIAALESGTQGASEMPPMSSIGNADDDSTPARVPGSAGQQFGRGVHRSSRSRNS